MRNASPLLLLVAALGGCGLFKKPVDDNEPTLATLAGRKAEVGPDAGLQVTERQAIDAYRKFLDVAPNAPQRAEAMRRLGDLEMDHADRELAEGRADKPDYKAAVQRYQAVLAAFPKDPANDRVLYQLARAHELDGQLELALKTLDRLVKEHPATPFTAEAQFRRGELLFTTRAYPAAEVAYATVLQQPERTPYHERALYMQGWSRFKQGRLEEALGPFFGVLDAKLGTEGELSRADRELVEDTFRVTSLSLSALQGAASIPPLISGERRLRYEHQVYEQLGELYLKQERVKDAADTFAAFARARPLHAQAPVLLSRVIETYEKTGFATQALAAKKDYVARYGVDSEFRRANPQGWNEAQPLVKTHLAELARHHHALAQSSKSADDAAEAVRWYRLWLKSFPEAPETPGRHFLLAELLADRQAWPEAAAEFEKVAYGYPAHAKSAEAGYGALLAWASQKPDTPELQRAVVASGLRFADAFPADPRTGSVLTNAAERLFTLQQGERAAQVAQRALANAGTAPADRRTAFTVVGHEAFDRKAWAEAERAYAQALALAGSGPSDALTERLAAAVYQQGEAARGEGRTRDAVAAFERVAAVAPNSPLRANAQIDAAAALITLKDWNGAAGLLEDFRRRYPGHTLQDDVTAKLAAVYLAQERAVPAAVELERLARNAEKAEPEVARAATWQAAELRDQAKDAGTANAYIAYLKRWPVPLEPAVQARWRLAQLSAGPVQQQWMRQVVQADAEGGAARTPRTRALAAQATLALAQPLVEAYRKIALVEPLQRNLKAKKAKMEEVLRAYAGAAEYGVPEAATAATFHTAALYQDFGKAMIASQRPKGLKKAELEQYNVMLEEQAFPFEEKAIELHEGNARRAAAGVWDEWVRASYAALATLKPGRWARPERTDPALPLNQKAIGLRQAGRFADARAAYEQALADQPQAAAPTLNLAILHDLYLGEPARALELMQHYMTLQANGDATVQKWIAELKNRKPAAAAANATAAATRTKDTP